MIHEISEAIDGLDNIDGMNVGNNRGVREAAQFDIKVKRLSNNIDMDLPYCVFGRQFVTSGYKDILPVPSGVTLKVRNGIQQGAGENPDNYCFTDFIFTQGSNVDIIRVSANAACAYPAILEATLGDVFQVAKVRVSLSDATKLDQFSTGLVIAQKSIFGAAQQNPISLGSNLAPNQNQPHVLDVPVSFPVDKETAVNGAMIASENLQVTLSFSVARIRKHNRKALKY